MAHDASMPTADPYVGVLMYVASRALETRAFDVAGTFELVDEGGG